jgi:hypothetical protein
LSKAFGAGGDGEERHDGGDPDHLQDRLGDHARNDHKQLALSKWKQDAEDSLKER